MAPTGALVFLLNVDLNISSLPPVCTYKKTPERLMGFSKN